MIAIFLAPFVIVGIIILIVCSFNQVRCPNCKKNLALKEINRTLLQKEKTSKLERHYNYNKKGQRTSRRDVRVYGTRYTYNVMYRCKNCGHTTTKIEYRDKY